MMDIFNMLGGMGNAQQQISQQTGATPSNPKAQWRRRFRCCSGP